MTPNIAHENKVVLVAFLPNTYSHCYPFLWGEGRIGIIFPIRAFSCRFSSGIADLDGSLQEGDKEQISESLIKIPKASLETHLESLLWISLNSALQADSLRGSK